MSDSENEFDDWEKKGAPKRKAAISDDDASFAPEPNTMDDSDVDSPAPPPKAPEPALVWKLWRIKLLLFSVNITSYQISSFLCRKKVAKSKSIVKQAQSKSSGKYFFFFTTRVWWALWSMGLRFNIFAICGALQLPQMIRWLPLRLQLNVKPKRLHPRKPLLPRNQLHRKRRLQVFSQFSLIRSNSV